jgi:hypothetical protein
MGDARHSILKEQFIANAQATVRAIMARSLIDSNAL